MAPTRNVWYSLAGLGLALGLAGCGGGGGGVFGNPSNPSQPSNPSSGQPTPPPIAIFVSDAVGLNPNDAGPDIIDVFQSNVNNNGNFTATIANSSMTTAVGLARFSNNIYVANQGQSGAGPAIFVFPKNANGSNVTPLAKIAGANTQLMAPTGVAVDASGFIYVADPLGGPSATGAIDVFAPGSNGNATPVRQIVGPNTQLDIPDAVAVDPAGNVFVANDAGAGGGSQFGDVVEFAPGAGANATPTFTYGSGTLNGPVALALDGSDNILVSCNNGNVLVEFANQNANSIASLTQGIQQPLGVAIDGSGFLYVVNTNVNNVSSIGPNVAIFGQNPSQPVLVFGGTSGSSTFVAPSGIAL